MGEKVLAQVKGLTEYAGGNYGQVSVARPAAAAQRSCPRSASTSCTGTGSSPFSRAGLRPGRDEITLGPRTLRTLGLHLGQLVKVDANGRTYPMRIVGSAIFASFGVGGGSATDLGTGAAVAASVLSQRNPQSCASGATCYNFFLLRYRPGTDLRAAAAQVSRATHPRRVPAGPMPGDHRPAAR